MAYVMLAAAVIFCGARRRARRPVVLMSLVHQNTKGGALRPITWALVALYLSAIIAANLITSHFGPSASIYTAAGLIGLNLTTRDRLHDLWGRHRLRNMALLILAGSALSFIAAHLFAGSAPSSVVARIALASCVAFGVAETADAVLYQALHRRPWLERANSSNVLGAILDSTVFVWIAFGWPFSDALWPIVFGQICAKVFGGYLWSLLLAHVRSRRLEPEAA